MTFEQAVKQTAEIKDAFHPGLRALRKIDKSRITATNPALLTGSIYLDEALSRTYPHESRWDYGIGQKPENSSNERVFWLEIHPGHAGELRVVLAKLEWLKQWLRESAVHLNGLQREFIWISTGKTSLTPTAPQ